MKSVSWANTPFGRQRLGVSFLALTLAPLATSAWAQDAAKEQDLPATTAAPASQPSDAVIASSAGQVSGRVTGVKSGGDAAGIEVALEGTRYSATTDASGFYRIEGVPAGSYTLVVRRTAAAREKRQAIVVPASQGVIADVALAQLSGADADVITVTGTRSNAARTSSSPISIVTAEDIERKQVTNMNDLFRGEIPGLFIINLGINDWTTQVFSRGNTSWNFTGSDTVNDYSKIFIDGIELARPSLIGMLDPRMIERIEMVRGPQAGVIYGTDGSGGLMKIVTKKGASDGRTGLHLVAQASAGIIESRAKPDDYTPILHDHSLYLYGGDDDFGYRLGGNIQSQGQWARGRTTESQFFSGGLRARRDDFTISLSALHGRRELKMGTRYPQRETLLAATLGYEAAPNWQHTLTLGYDKNRFSYFSTRDAQLTDYTRRTVRYFTTYDAKLSSDFSAVFTAGGDATFYNSYGFEAFGLRTINGKVNYANALDYHENSETWRNYGYYGMVEFNFRDRLYLTAAARVEEGLRYVAESEKRQVQPRFGLAYLIESGPATLKLRGQWGRSVRAPVSDRAILGWRDANFAQYAPNPDIRPEVKEGWDAGFDLTWRGVGKLSVTRFDEEGRDLIMFEQFSERPLPRQRRYINYGVITNKGWEIEAEATVGPLSVRGNLLLTDNRIKRIAPALATGNNVPGNRRIDVPKYVIGGTATLRVLSGTVGANAFVIGPRPQWFGLQGPTLWRLNLRAEQRITPSMDIFARVDNVMNHQDSERDANTLSPGRAWVLGIRRTI